MKWTLVLDPMKNPLHLFLNEVTWLMRITSYNGFFEEITSNQGCVWYAKKFFETNDIWPLTTYLSWHLGMRSVFHLVSSSIWDVN